MHGIYLYIVVPLLFFFISFLFAMLGMGGGQLYIPILLFLGLDMKTEAIPLGLFLNVLTTLVAAITYSLKKMIDWKTLVPFVVLMFGSAPLGTMVNLALPTKWVIASFATIALLSAFLMLSRYKPKGNLEGYAKVIVAALAGGALGFISGLTGLGGGNLVVPILYLMGIQPKIAAATSSGIVTFSAAISLISHLKAGNKVDIWLWTFTALSVLIGSRLGAKFMVEKLSQSNVKRLFGWVVLGVALLMYYKAFFLKH